MKQTATSINKLLFLLCGGCGITLAATTDGFTFPSVSTLPISESISGDGGVPTGFNISYISYSSTLTLSTTSNSTITDGQPSITSLIGRTSQTLSSDTSTSSSLVPQNTQPCNQYLELCDKRYSNITSVAAHNFAFAQKGNAASNQQYSVTEQLNDGIRLLQAQTHFVNNTLFFCHTSCDLLNAGSVQDIFNEIKSWVDKHPFDVISILLGNGDVVNVEEFAKPIQASGLEKYAFVPATVPLANDAWPTLAEMIIRHQRVVFFLDYEANQTKVPYVLDEFTHVWETPFSPIDSSFPCTVERPPGLAVEVAKQRMYIANHNLNVQVSLFGSKILIPDTATINQTNAVSGPSSLGKMSSECAGNWTRPPTFLLVDYYNYGNFPGSVFEIAAQANGVKYNNKCCGGEKSGSSSSITINMGFVIFSSLVGLIIYI